MKEPGECRDYLADIPQRAEEISGFIKGMDFDQFSADQKTIYAIFCAIEIIGEPARCIPDELRRKCPYIPWRGMTGMRDKLIHDYHHVNLRLVWQTATENVPAVVPQIRQMLDDLGG